jgi:hypothetical protein
MTTTDEPRTRGRPREISDAERMELGECIYRMRREDGLSFRDAARLFGVSLGTAVSLEKAFRGSVERSINPEGIRVRVGVFGEGERDRLIIERKEVAAE